MQAQDSASRYLRAAYLESGVKKDLGQRLAEAARAAGFDADGRPSGRVAGLGGASPAPALGDGGGSGGGTWATGFAKQTRVCLKVCVWGGGGGVLSRSMAWL